MKIFGLTGGIGCGKSSISKHWSNQGLPIIDPDLFSRMAVNPSTSIGSNTLEKIKIVFGNDILQEDGYLNRTKLGSIVFDDKKLLNIFEGIIFPVIKQLMDDEILKYQSMGYKLACYDNALLIEKSNYENYRPIVVIHVDYNTQIERISNRNPNLSKNDIIKRIHSQMSSVERLKYGDFSIDNSGTLENTLYEADLILENIKKEIL